MGIQKDIFQNNNPPACEDFHLNGFLQEINNAIEAMGLTVNPGDFSQLAESLKLAGAGASMLANEIFTQGAIDWAPSLQVNSWSTKLLYKGVVYMPNGKKSGLLPFNTASTVAEDVTNGNLVATKIQSKEELIGDIRFTWTATPSDGMLRANGAEVSRSSYPKLWKWANDNNLVIAQSAKDGDAFGKAANYGTGDGSTTFTLPHFHQGQVFRGSSSSGRFLETQGDAIRNITGLIQTNNGYLFGAIGSGAGALRSAGPVGDYINNPIQQPGSQNSVSISLDASRSVPTASENRMKTTNTYIDIYTGE